jgi:hypothetical protein
LFLEYGNDTRSPVLLCQLKFPEEKLHTSESEGYVTCNTITMPHIQSEIQQLSFCSSVNRSLHLTMETDAASKILCSLVFFRIPNNGQSPKTQ